MKAGLRCALILTLISSVSAFSQEAGGIYAPFVSRLRADLNGTEVVLSWTDPVKTENLVYRILRHSRPIDSGNIRQAEILATVAPGIETIYRPARRRCRLVVCRCRRASLRRPDVRSDDSLEKYPGRSGSDRLGQFPAGQGGPDPFTENSPVILRYLGFSVTAVPARTRTWCFVRGSRPLDSDFSLDYAVEIGRSRGSEGSFEDNPLPGVRWYYAVLDASLFDSGTSGWMDTAAFAGPLERTGSEQTARDVQMRPAPLPVLRIDRSVRDGRAIQAFEGDLPERQSLGREAVSTLATLLGPMEGALWVEPSPVILAPETAYSEDRKQLHLNSIISKSFSGESWPDAEDELFALLASNGVDKATRARILFYIGQCRYFQDKREGAFLAFLAASDEYYAQARTWMIRIYADLTPVG